MSIFMLFYPKRQNQYYNMPLVNIPICVRTSAKNFIYVLVTPSLYFLGISSIILLIGFFTLIVAIQIFVIMHILFFIMKLSTKV